MNRYTVVIGFKGYLHLEDVERLVIPNGNLIRAEPSGQNGGIRLSDGSWLNQGGSEEHRLKIDFAATESNVDIYANVLKDKYLAHISLFLNSAIRDARLIEIIRLGGSGGSQTTQHLSITGSAFIVRPPESQDIITKANCTLGSLINGDRDEDVRSVGAFSKAISNDDRYKEYWELYSLLVELLPRDSRGERMRLNGHLLQEYPEDDIYHNDNKNQDTHLVIAIRDTLSHIDSTYSSETLDVASNIVTANDRMKRLARKILLARF